MGEKNVIHGLDVRTQGANKGTLGPDISLKKVHESLSEQLEILYCSHLHFYCLIKNLHTCRAVNNNLL